MKKFEKEIMESSFKFCRIVEREGIAGFGDGVAVGVALKAVDAVVYWMEFAGYD
jgi:hypothetical protein